MLDEQILVELSDEVAIENEISRSTDVEMLITEGIRRITIRVTESEPVNGAGSSASSGNGNRARARLPKIELQRFSGDPKAYQAWWDTYESMIHRNPDLAEIDKFNYLKSCVTGSAKSAILGMSTTAANYRNAIAIIQGRFGKKAVVVGSHMETLMKLPILTSSGDYKELRILYDKVETNIRSLQALGIDSASYGPLLVPVVLRGLPEDVRMILSRTFDADNDVWELDALLNAFKAEVEAKERCSAMSDGGAVEKNANSGYRGRADRRPQHSTTNDDCSGREAT